MLATSAAKTAQGEIRWILALLCGYVADGIRHVLVSNTQKAISGLLRRVAGACLLVDLQGKFGESIFDCSNAEGLFVIATKYCRKRICLNPPRHDIGIGNG